MPGIPRWTYSIIDAPTYSLDCLLILHFSNLVLRYESNDLVSILLVEVDPDQGPRHLRSLHPTYHPPDLKHFKMSKLILLVVGLIMVS